MIPEEHKELYKKLSRAISCGKCGKTINIDKSEYTCKQCGRTLCDRCGARWGVCEDHVPVCNHPGILPITWNQPRPEPCKVVGSCIHNYSCPVCGFGIGCDPCPCEPNSPIIVTDLQEL